MALIASAIDFAVFTVEPLKSVVKSKLMQKPLILISATAIVWIVPISNVLPAFASVAEPNVTDLIVANVFEDKTVVAFGPVIVF